MRKWIILSIGLHAITITALIVLGVVLGLKILNVASINNNATTRIADLETVTEPIYFDLYNKVGDEGCGNSSLVCKSGPIKMSNYYDADCSLDAEHLLAKGFKAPENGTYFLVITAVSLGGQGSVIVKTNRRTYR